jgi:hypothetical protein
MRFAWIICLLITGCASMMESWRAQSCNAEAALEQGMNDARSGRQMNSQYLAPCPAESQTALKESYKQGYLTGIESGKDNSIHIQIGGNSAPRFRCELKVFFDVFSGEGHTEGQAREKALAACREKYTIHCNGVQCTKVN